MKSRKYLLAVDAGPSATVFALFDGDRVYSRWAMETRAGRTVDEYAVWLMTLFSMQGVGPGNIKGAVVCSAVPDVQPMLVRLCEGYLNVQPLVVAPGLKTGLLVDYGTPADLAPDRVANLVAAAELCSGPCVVVDMGTVTHIDVLGPKKRYLGGLVLPGARMALQALAQVPRLPEVAFSPPTDKIIGRNLAHSLQAGAGWGQRFAVEGAISQIWTELGTKGKTIATGGMAAQSGVRFEITDPDLTLKGLKTIYTLNAPRLAQKTARRA
jgi:type III pantothenate kinase